MMYFQKWGTIIALELRLNLTQFAITIRPPKRGDPHLGVPIIPHHRAHLRHRFIDTHPILHQRTPQQCSDTRAKLFVRWRRPIGPIPLYPGLQSPNYPFIRSTTGRQTLNIIALNLNHRTHKKRLPEGLFPALATHSPDVIVFNELVIGDGRPELHHAFRSLGLSFVAVSPAVPYSPGRWQNQVAIASRWPIQVMAVPAGPDASANTNVLSVQTAGTSLIGVRAPGYKRMADWYAWWEWFIALADAQVLIGDFNVDPARARKKDRAFQPLMTSKGYARATPTA